SSPLLDNVSIYGATGVLINIVGGEDLTLGETTQINEIIHDAVGDDALIIFGAANDDNLKGSVRVTVIATGFDKAVTGEPVVERGTTAQGLRFHRRPANPGMTGGSAAPVGGAATPAPPQASPQQPQSRPTPNRPASSPDVSDMEVPTFIRRQMD